MTQPTKDNDNRSIWYALLILGVIMLAAAGYTGYVLYPRFELPAVTGASLFVLAAAAGIGSFFSPCSFPLLVTLLARETGAEGKERSALPQALRFATALAVGATLFLLLAGALIAAGGGPLFQGVTFTSTAGRTIRIIIGVLLILLGLIQTNVLPVSFDSVAGLVRPLQRAQSRLRRERPTAGFVLFGFGYILAGFG
ncbi:MAG TPA: cytochrome c biogenesis protein CcdA [Anaerolineae bacterium]